MIIKFLVILSEGTKNQKINDLNCPKLLWCGHNVSIDESYYARQYKEFFCLQSDLLHLLDQGFKWKVRMSNVLRMLVVDRTDSSRATDTNIMFGPMFNILLGTILNEGWLIFSILGPPSDSIYSKKQLWFIASLDAPSFSFRVDVKFGWSFTEESSWKMTHLPISSNNCKVASTNAC